MPLKISFESDLKGFERVERALRDQEKLLNANADAVERLQKAQSGMNKEAFDIGQSRGLKEAADQMKNLTGALDSLQANQSGFRAFLNNFTEFRKELEDISKVQSGEIFGAIDTQIDTLKKSLAGSTQLTKNLRQEISQLRAEGKTEEASKATEQLRQVETQALTERRLLQDARLQRAYRTPLLENLGLPSMGIGSLQQIMGRAPGIMAAGYAMNKAADFAFQFEAMGPEQAANFMYRQQMSVLDAARQGNIGRLFLREQGLGREGRLMSRLEGRSDALAGREGFFSRIGAEMSLGDDLTESLSLGVRRAFKGMYNTITGREIERFGGNKAYTDSQLLEEASTMDARKQDVINRMTSQARQLYTNPSFARFETGLGFEGVQSITRRLNAGNVTFAEAQSVLRDAERYGITDRIAGTRLVRGLDELGLTETARRQLIRQQAYRPGEGAESQYNLIGQIFAGARARGVTMNAATREAISNVIGQQVGQFAGQVDMNQIAAPLMGAMGAMQETGVNLVGQERVQGAQAIQSFVQSRGQQAGTMESMAIETTLIRLGVRNPVARSQIAQLLTRGQAQSAARIVSRITNQPVDQVLQQLREAMGNVGQFRRQILAGSDEEYQTLQAAFSKEGRSFLGAAMSGDVGSQLAVAGMGEAVEQFDLFGAAQTGTLKPELPGTTAARGIRGAEARLETEAMRQADRMAQRVGTEGQTAGQNIVSLFTSFSDSMIKEVRDGLNEVFTTQSEVLKQFAAGLQEQSGSGLIDENAAMNQPVTKAGQRGK